MRRLLEWNGELAFVPLAGVDEDGEDIDVDAKDFDERVVDYRIQLDDGEIVLVKADLVHSAKLITSQRAS